MAVNPTAENNCLFYKSSMIGELKRDYLETETRCRRIVLGQNFKAGSVCWIIDGVLRIFSPLC